jgi:hypothetical protein
MLPRKIKIEEGGHWSPSQEEVDTYIGSLEHRLLARSEYMRYRPRDKDRGAAPIRDRPSNSFALSWGLVGIAAGCLWELARIILQALN